MMHQKARSFLLSQISPMKVYLFEHSSNSVGLSEKYVILFLIARNESHCNDCSVFLYILSPQTKRSMLTYF